ncbi:alcohol dehydrogenase catalytic domain-containing protein [Amycolatopsis sp. NPDC098790]|uniref:alcohol dehydrogenase catalytic domain-containing protein n=1 Tax=Amycolatopsis sp. NPDC098790 TaxID=3363939 RepID=UPI0038165121
MKAAVVPAVGARWELREVPAPRPGPGEVLIRVRASGVCSNDVLATTGVLPFPSVEPAITGHEPVGEVVETGPGVRTREVGDLVGVTWIRGACGRCAYCRGGSGVSGQAGILCAAPTSTGFTVPGGHAEYLVAAAGETVPIPDGLAPELAAPMLCAGYTSWCALRAAEPKPHERIAVLGVGRLGHLALQFSRACGFETVAITSSPDKHEVARELGADLVVADGAELRDAGGADVVLVTAPAHRAAADSLQGLRPDGRLVLAGIDPAEPFTLPPSTLYPLFALRHRILGATHNGREYLAEALDLAARGAVTPMVETFDKERVADAVDAVAKGAARFCAVVSF